MGSEMRDETGWMLPPMLKNGLIMLASGFVASILCAKVFAATLPADSAVTPTLVAVAPVEKIDDATAAAALRAFIASRRPIAGIMPADTQLR